MQLPRTFLAALLVGLLSPLAAPTDPAAADPAPTLDSAAALRPDRPDHRHLSAAWSTLFSAEGSPGAGAAAAAPAAAAGPHRRRHHHRAHPDAAAAKACPSCGVQRELLEEEGHDELTALRIEFVKQQILKKLGLKEPPVVPKRTTTMPKPLALAGVALPLPARHRQDNADEFYGRTDQVILFPTEKESACSGGPDTSCFLFKLPADIQGVDVTHAELWLYRKGSDVENATLDVSEVVNWDLDASFQRRTPLATVPVAEGEGWVKVDFARPIKYWFEFNELVKMVEASGVAVATDGPYKPFLVVATNPVSKVRRPKRNARCVPGMAECCRDNLYVSFKEIGWDDWILQPAGYEAYFCRGSCTTAASLTITGSHHNAIVRRLMQTGKKVDLVPCCTPTKYSEISLLYMNNNQTYIQKTLPNMVVEACGCN